MSDGLLAGLPAFLFYLVVGAAILMAVMYVFKLVTPHDEIGLIRENNPAAAIGLAGGMLGLVMPIASASLNSAGLLDFAVWAAIGCVVQIAAFFLAGLFVPNLHVRIREGHVSAGVFAGAMAVTFGIVNAVSMVP